VSTGLPHHQAIPVPSIATTTAVREAGAARPSRPRRRRWTRFILPAYSWLVIAYLVFPIAVMILYSFNKVTTGLPQVSFAWNGFTLQWYRGWSDVPGLTAAFWLSIRLAILSTLFSTAIGTLLALALVRYQGRRFRGKTLVEQTMFLNIAAPEVVLGASLLGLFVTVNVARGFVTLLLAHVAFSIAYVAVTVRARMTGFDRSLEEAAADLGANSWVIFRKITFPLIMPGILAGALMAFALSIDDFVTSNFVSGAATPFPVWVYGATRIGIPPQVFVFGTAIFTVGILCAISSVIIGWRKPT
jgi:spermidine/putrescine transport system permease protein